MSDTKKEDLKEGIDFYWENGRKVLSTDYLHRRGYCCESGCRHCPYGYGPGQPMPDFSNSSSIINPSPDTAEK